MADHGIAGGEALGPGAGGKGGSLAAGGAPAIDDPSGGDHHVSHLVAVLIGRAEAGAVDAVHLGRGVVVDVFAMEAAAHAAGLAVEEDPIDGEENDLSGTAAPLSQCRSARGPALFIVTHRSIKKQPLKGGSRNYGQERRGMPAERRGRRGKTTFP